MAGCLVEVRYRSATCTGEAMVKQMMVKVVVRVPRVVKVEELAVVLLQLVGHVLVFEK